MERTQVFKAIQVGLRESSETAKSKFARIIDTCAMMLRDQRKTYINEHIRTAAETVRSSFAGTVLRKVIYDEAVLDSYLYDPRYVEALAWTLLSAYNSLQTCDLSTINAEQIENDTRDFFSELKILVWLRAIMSGRQVNQPASSKLTSSEHKVCDLRKKPKSLKVLLVFVEAGYMSHQDNTSVWVWLKDKSEFAYFCACTSRYLYGKGSRTHWKEFAFIHPITSDMRGMVSRWESATYDTPKKRAIDRIFDTIKNEKQ